MKHSVLIVFNENKKEWGAVASYLRRKGYHLYPAASSKTALGILKKEPINIVISDYNLTNTNNLGFLKKIKEISPTVEVIFLSEKPSLLKGIEAMKAGAYDFYEFPVNHRLLNAVIEKAIEKETLYAEKRALERKMRDSFHAGKVIGRSKAMKNVMEVVKSVAFKNANILLTGETGSGKEMIANLIHHNSQRSSHPFVKMNCAAFSEGVLESELFGHEKGAFTGAITKRIGRFELADKGTIFLDEIGDMPMGTQVKLLRVLQEQEFERVGGNETLKINIRVIAATNQNLKKLISRKRFREDLYYRLNVVNIEMPPLRERKDDIPLLVSTFIAKMNEERGYHITGITREAMQMLINYSWPGNVRELENTIESAMAISEKDTIEPKYLPSFLLFSQAQEGDFYQFPKTMTLSEIGQEIIKITLESTSGNKTRAAKLLGIGLRTLQRKVKYLNDKDDA
jgi:DNA-binding NtrC family response regulator